VFDIGSVATIFTRNQPLSQPPVKQVRRKELRDVYLLRTTGERKKEKAKEHPEPNWESIVRAAIVAVAIESYREMLVGCKRSIYFFAGYFLKKYLLSSALSFAGEVEVSLTGSRSSRQQRIALQHPPTHQRPSR
jgi:hypothetical protein